jgi:hypothetical protein
MNEDNKFTLKHSIHINIIFLYSSFFLLIFKMCLYSVNVSFSVVRINFVQNRPQSKLFPVIHKARSSGNPSVTSTFFH